MSAFGVAAGTKDGGEGSPDGGKAEVEREHKAGHDKNEADAVLGGGEPGENGGLRGAALLLDGRAKLGEHRAELRVDLRGGMKDEARDDKAAGVDGRHREEDGKAAEQAEARPESCLHARGADPGAIDAEDDDGSADRPEPGDQNQWWQSEGDQRERGGDGSGECGVADRGRPHDVVRPRCAEDTRGEAGVERGALLLGLREELL